VKKPNARIIIWRIEMGRWLRELGLFILSMGLSALILFFVLQAIGMFARNFNLGDGAIFMAYVLWISSPFAFIILALGIWFWISGFLSKDKKPKPAERTEVELKATPLAPRSRKKS
jgi:hypothetical protein